MATQVIRNHNHSQQYSIIIPAAGMGRRMRSYGPKALLKINETKDVITNQLEIIRHSFRKYEVILVTGFESDKLMNHVPNWIVKIENERYEETNVLRSIGMGLRAARCDKVLIIYGDLALSSKIFDGSSLYDKSTVFISENQLMTEEIGCTINNKEIEFFCYHLPMIWAQIVYLTGKELKLLQTLAWNRDNERLFGFEAMNEILERGGKFLAQIIPKDIPFVDIDSSKDLQTARRIFS